MRALAAALLLLTSARALGCGVSFSYQVDSVAPGIHAAVLMQWNVTGELLESATVGAVPAAGVRAINSYVMRRAPTALAAAVVRNVRARCNSAREDATCAVTIVVGDQGGAPVTLDLAIPAGVDMLLPAARFWMALDAPGVLPATVTFVGTLACADGDEPTATVFDTFDVVQDPPLSYVAMLRAAQASTPCSAESCLFELESSHGPFSTLGAHAVTVAAELYTADAASPGVFTTAGIITHAARLVLSNVSCARSPDAWRAAIGSGLSPIVRFPRATIPGTVALSERHLTRLLRLAARGSTIDKIYAIAIAIELDVRAGVRIPTAVADLVTDATDIMVDCPPDDTMVWSAVKFTGRVCAGRDEPTLFGVYAALLYHASGRSPEFPACPS